MRNGCSSTVSGDYRTCDSSSVCCTSIWQLHMGRTFLRAALARRANATRCTSKATQLTIAPRRYESAAHVVRRRQPASRVFPGRARRRPGSGALAARHGSTPAETPRFLRRTHRSPSPVRPGSPTPCRHVRWSPSSWARLRNPGATPGVPDMPSLCPGSGPPRASRGATVRGSRGARATRCFRSGRVAARRDGAAPWRGPPPHRVAPITSVLACGR